MDKLTQAEVKVVALSPQFKFFLQRMQEDCNQQLGTLSTKDADQLVADYKRIAMTREVYEDLLVFLSKLTTEGTQT